MIPSKIHYCWFGKNPKPPLIQKCIQSWKKVQPDFEIIEWNEDNFDVESNEFVKEAYKSKKWAFISDYVRAKALFEVGGFYLDTDMELKLPLNEFRKHRCICAFEMKGVPFSAFWAAEKGHPMPKKVMDHYESVNFSEATCTFLFSKLLENQYNINPSEDVYQESYDGLVVYPSQYFSLDLPKNYVTHHFYGSWHNGWDGDNSPYKKYVHTYGVVKNLIDLQDSKKEIHNLIFNQHIFSEEELLEKIPIRMIAKFLLNLVKRKLWKK